MAGRILSATQKEMYTVVSVDKSADVCPFSVCLSLYSLNSTIFQLISYLYLSWNGYFSDQLCELFFPGMGRCLVEVTKNGASAALVF